MLATTVCRSLHRVLYSQRYFRMTLQQKSSAAMHRRMSSSSTDANRAQSQSLEFHIDLMRPLDKRLRNYQYGRKDSGPKLLELLETLQERPWLRSVKIYYTRAHAGLLNQPIPEQGMTIYDQLRKLPNLEELHIYSGDGSCFHKPRRHDASLSQFSNLQSLVVHEIDWINYTDHELEKALIASPGLRHLGLSCGVYNEYISENDLLFRLARGFYRLRRQHRLPTLQLSSLHLGSCAMPWMFTREHLHKDDPLRENDYLREITDITSLECLRLDNIQRDYPGYEQVVPYRHIVPSLFTGACNLRSLTVQRLGPDIRSLIQPAAHRWI